jgi:nucleoside-diphosphate-sugar epimerase
VLREAVTTGRLELRTSWQSNKDYVAVTDVVRALEAMALAGSDPIVNVAAGCNTSHGEIVDQLRRIMPLDVTVQSNAPTVGFPSINTTRLDALQPGKREHVLDALPRLVSALSS